MDAGMFRGMGTALVGLGVAIGLVIALCIWTIAHFVAPHVQIIWK